jgi:UTP--glucose-1-phosphate uridylyltransferase
MKKIRKAIFPVAGLGTRFLPATKSMPKEMLAIIDKPIIQYAVEEAKAAGIEEFIFVTGRGKSALEDFFDYSYELNAVLMHRGKKEDLEIVNQVVLDPGQVIYTRQQEPLGLGHAVWCARHMIQDEPFAVLLADDLILSKKSCLQQMMEVYEKKQGNIVAVMEVSKEETSQYGIIDPESQTGNVFKIKGVIEKPDPRKAPSQWAVIGRYILQSDIFHELENLKTGAGGEVQLTDAMSKLLKRSDFYGVNFEGRRFDCGTKQGLLAANMASALERPDMREGALKAMKKLIEEA